MTTKAQAALERRRKVKDEATVQAVVLGGAALSMGQKIQTAYVKAYYEGRKEALRDLLAEAKRLHDHYDDEGMYYEVNMHQTMLEDLQKFVEGEDETE